MEIMNSNNLVEYDITKEMHELQRLGISQYYPLKTKFENNDGWQWEPMWMIFDIKQQDLRHK